MAIPLRKREGPRRSDSLLNYSFDKAVLICNAALEAATDRLRGPSIGWANRSLQYG